VNTANTEAPRFKTFHQVVQRIFEFRKDQQALFWVIKEPFPLQ
jgi:hypothetical protein